jgi:hypothetical protein
MFLKRKPKKSVCPNFRDYQMFMNRVDKEESKAAKEYNIGCANRAYVQIDWKRVPRDQWPAEVARSYRPDTEDEY